MCGIVGYSVPKESIDNYIDSLKTGIQSLKHRGPDNTGIWISDDGLLGMAHSRLSIIDLSPEANQPMEDQNTGIVISFNGEVYNFLELRKELENLGYIFSTTSDTEVLLKGYLEWSSTLFKKLRGMFVIVVFDPTDQKIILARDHSGQKPLYYSYDKDKKIFLYASELKGLFKFDNFKKDISFKGLNHLFAQGYCANELSIYKNVNKLAAGSSLTFLMEQNELQTEKFWFIEDIISKKNSSHKSESELLDKLEVILLEALELQFRSDVPVGLMLSGGVDSSLIVALASQIKNNLDTYTVRFPGYKKFDESHHAQLIAQQFHTNHTEIEASSVDPEIFDELATFYDEPIFDTSMVPTFLLSKLISKHCKVAIGGDGGDELFGGYPHYDKLLRIRNHTKYVPQYLRQNMSNITQFLLPLGTRGVKTMEFYGTNLVKDYPNTAEFFSDKEQSKLFNSNLINSMSLNFFKDFNPHIFNDLIDTATYQDFSNYLREDILVKVDRASMANSLEIRSPFLDHKLIEFAFTEIPSHLKVQNFQRKILLKKLATRHLPQNFDFHRKQGFSLPLKELIISPRWHEYFCSKIQSSDPDIFNHKYAFQLLQNQTSYNNNAERMVGLVFFMVWVERFNPSFKLTH